MLSTACHKKERNAEVIQNCTGSYLRINGASYKVLNYALLNSYETGDKIKVQYTFDDSSMPICIQPIITCELYYDYQDDIIIKAIY